MSKLGIIYCYKNKVNGKCYIGQTVNEKKRIRDHRESYTNNSCSYFHRAVKKHGFENFEYFVIHSGKTKEELNELERIEIERHNTLSPSGYNLKTGGKSFAHHTDTIKKIKETNSKKWKDPCFVEKRMSVLKSKEYSDMLKEKISKMTTEKKKDMYDNSKKARENAKTKNAPIKAKNDRIRSLLEMVNKSERARYHKTEEYKLFSMETRVKLPNKINVIASVPIFCTTNETFYLSATKAADALGLDQGCISKVLRGDGKSTGGYYFRKATNEESSEIKARYACI